MDHCSDPAGLFRNPNAGCLMHSVLAWGSRFFPPPSLGKLQARVDWRAATAPWLCPSLAHLEILASPSSCEWNWANPFQLHCWANSHFIPPFLMRETSTLASVKMNFYHLEKKQEIFPQLIQRELPSSRLFSSWTLLAHGQVQFILCPKRIQSEVGVIGGLCGVGFWQTWFLSHGPRCSLQNQMQEATIQKTLYLEGTHSTSKDVGGLEQSLRFNLQLYKHPKWSHRVAVQWCLT